MKINLKQAKYGDVIAFYPNSLFSKAITWLDKSPYSHVATYLCKIGNFHFMLESTSTKGGFVISKIREDWRNFDVYDMSAFKTSLRPMKDMIKIVDERAYDTKRIIDLLFYYGLGVKIGKSSADRLICAEAVNLQFNNELVPLNPTPNTITARIQ